jgi:hypothetical protein
MHNIIIVRRRGYLRETGVRVITDYVELEALDNDEFDLYDELNRLMDMLNSNEPELAEFAKNRCRFLGWEVEQIYEPSDYYSDDSGYVWCINM